MLRPIQTDNAPKAVGPYSQAMIAGDWLFCSGQIPIDPATGAIISGTTSEQANRVMNNLAAVLEAAGARWCDVVRTTIYLKDMQDFATVNDVYASFLQAPFPARATVEVARLPKDVRVEIDAVAYLGRK